MVYHFLTFHGFRTTNARLIASAVARSEEPYGGIERVRATRIRQPRPSGTPEQQIRAPVARFWEPVRLNWETLAAYAR